MLERLRGLAPGNARALKPKVSAALGEVSALFVRIFKYL